MCAFQAQKMEKIFANFEMNQLKQEEEEVKEIGEYIFQICTRLKPKFNLGSHVQL